MLRLVKGGRGVWCELCLQLVERMVRAAYVIMQPKPRVHQSSVERADVGTGLAAPTRVCLSVCV